MSVHQVDFFIVPKQGNYTLFEGLNLKTFLGEDSSPEEGVFIFDDDLLWRELNYKFSEIKNALTEISPLGESWSKELKIFGHNDFNSIQLFLEGEYIVSITLRVNVTIDYNDFLKKVLNFCELNNFLIVDSNFDILELDYNVIIDNLNNSLAYRNYRNFKD